MGGVEDDTAFGALRLLLGAEPQPADEEPLFYRMLTVLAAVTAMLGG
ncbi:hypothetical protein M8Z33_27540 [Streptomyces sp. ZAF1911]|nr:hypothetical protein [Streptomyces sp. ZAF1911]MDD9380341.1 hypothetical protein [Streptomyces sp. ZAF1911]